MRGKRKATIDFAHGVSPLRRDCEDRKTTARPSFFPRGAKKRDFRPESSPVLKKGPILPEIAERSAISREGAKG